MKAAKILILLLTALVIVIFADCSRTEKEGTEEIIHASRVSNVMSRTKALGESKPDSSAPIFIESNVSETSRIEFSINNEKLFKTLEEYFDADSTKEVIEKIAASADEGTEKTVYIENGNTLVFQTKIIQALTSGGIEEFKKNISGSVSESKDTFMSFVYDLEECVDNDDIRVLVRYIDSEDNIIFEDSFDNGSKSRKEYYTAENE